ncbi:peptidase S41-like protein [Sunxiuqinia elliptica]|uniref:Peptidase S41-like protein n=1 Tax=Sunxiuqinia elliptica TaxID=655355 RepID=A0A4R6GK29_9BACT|nr:peptidase S41-like protein [Sunxiuqinia elliptica]TDO66874.1 peptidase S41-like protein [Sunxiuqinia elliptica]
MTPKDYLDEVFKIVEEHSIRRDSVDFNAIKKDAYARLEEYTRLKNKVSIEDCYPILKIILIDLGDRHSFFMPKEQVEKWQTTSKSSDINKIITFDSKYFNQGIGYIHMKGFGSGDSISIQQYADSLQNQIKSIDNENLKGWIIDLRENKGGNCWPMLTGLGPFLGNGICGYFIDNKQKKSSWFYRDGESGIDSMIIAKVSKRPYHLINDLNPIAILTGHQTASSGEVVVTAFHNKSNARSFGEPTRGLSTGNANYTLSDGSMIFLTRSIYSDREGNVFGGKIEPDEIIKFSYQSIGQPDDPVIKKAMEWINEN